WSRSRGRPRAGCRAPTARSRTGSVSPGIGSDGEGDGERKREDDEGGKQRTTHEASTRAGSSCIPAGGFSDRGPQSMSVACKTPGRVMRSGFVQISEGDGRWRNRLPAFEVVEGSATHFVVSR